MITTARTGVVIYLFTWPVMQKGLAPRQKEPGPTATTTSGTGVSPPNIKILTKGLSS